MGSQIQIRLEANFFPSLNCASLHWAYLTRYDWNTVEWDIKSINPSIRACTRISMDIRVYPRYVRISPWMYVYMPGRTCNSRVYAYFHGYPCKWSEYTRCTRKFVVYAYVHVEFWSITNPKCIFLFLSLYVDSMENEVPILHINGYPWISAYYLLISMEIWEKGDACISQEASLGERKIMSDI